MAYSPRTWADGSGEYVNATNLNLMETGIDEAHDAIENLSTGHDHDGTDSKTLVASNITNTPAGNIVATDVQAAITELDGQDTTHAALTTGTHGVSGTILGTEDVGVAGGVAELDGDGGLLSEGYYIKLPLSPGNAFYLYNRTNSEVVSRFTRLGTNDYKADLYESGAWQRIQTASMKYVNNGITGWVTAPATASSSGTAGQIAYDSSYFYVCTATDTWKRVAIASW